MKDHRRPQLPCPSSQVASYCVSHRDATLQCLAEFAEPARRLGPGSECLILGSEQQ